MIKIAKGTTSSIVVTLNELTVGTMSPPLYLFNFINTGLGITNSKTCMMTDISDNTSRYNKFIFTEGVDDGINGSLILLPGFWEYQVEQVSEAGLTFGLYSLATVEVGKVYIEGTQSVSNSIYL